MNIFTANLLAKGLIFVLKLFPVPEWAVMCTGILMGTPSFASFRGTLNEATYWFMACVNHFITASLVRSIHKNDLLQILQPLQHVLTQMGLWFGEKDPVPIGLVGYLRASQDEGMPQVEEDLFLLHSIANERCADSIMSELALQGVDYDVLKDDVQALAAKLLFTGRESCRRIASLKNAQKRRCYDMYIPIASVEGMVKTLSEKQILNLKCVFSEFFRHAGKSAYNHIFQHDTDEYIFICVAHGAAKTRETAIEADTNTVITYRPELEDIIRIDKDTHEIAVSIHKGKSQHLKSFYIDALGKAFCNGASYIPNRKFHLDTLRLGKDALKLGRLDSRIKEVRLHTAKYIRSDGGKITVGECDVALELKKQSQYIKEIVQVQLDFIVNGQSYSLKIRGDNRADYPDDLDARLIDTFLLQNNLIIPHRHESSTLELVA